MFIRMAAQTSLLQAQKCAFEILILIEQRLRIGDIGGFVAIPAF